MGYQRRHLPQARLLAKPKVGNRHNLFLPSAGCWFSTNPTAGCMAVLFNLQFLIKNNLLEASNEMNIYVNEQLLLKKRGCALVLDRAHTFFYVLLFTIFIGSFAVQLDNIYVFACDTP